MCTSIVFNGSRTIAGFNLDILDMEHRVTPSDKSVTIDILDKKEGWMPLFGANARGDFVGMPTCWPFDDRSNPTTREEPNVITLDIDLLTQQKTFNEIRRIADAGPICSTPLTFMTQLSNKDGNVLQIVPGQGHRYLERPRYSILTNFSPFKKANDEHPWMGIDRYDTATQMLSDADDGFGIEQCFEVLQAVSQETCPTVVSMVFDVTGTTVHWCEHRCYDSIHTQYLEATGAFSHDNDEDPVYPEEATQRRSASRR